MEKRVFLFSELQPEADGGPFGGQGQIVRRAILTRGESLAPDSPFVASGVNILQPGSGIGLHKHAADEEVYFIISGQGEYIDNAGQRHPVQSGDTAFCCKGESHGLENTGAEPLLFAAVIAK